MAIIEASRGLDECEAELEALKRRLHSLPVIEQAKGMIMAAEGCTEDEAFDVLRRASQRENRKLRDIAADFVRLNQERARAVPNGRDGQR